MKLLFVDFKLPQLLKDAEFPAGGWTVQLRQLLLGLADAGRRCGVLTWKGANAYVGAQSVCDLIETYDPARGIRKVRAMTYHLPALYAAARAYQPDVIVQSCSGVQTATMALVARGLRIPFVHRIASDADTDGRNMQYLGPIGRLGFHLALKNSQLVICQNSYQLGRIRNQFPGKAAEVLHNAIQIPSSAPVRQARAERNYVAWLGNFSQPKNMALLADVARGLPDIEFRIAGTLKDNETHGPTLLALDALKRLANVTFVGYFTRDAVWGFLNGAIALLCTSDFEGFSNTFLESFVTGTPIVLRSIVDPDAIVGENGLGLVASDGSDLIGRVREMCAMDADRYEVLGQRCRRYVEDHHAPAAAVRKLISILEPMTERQP